jgi:hypothetical protein
MIMKRRSTLTGLASALLLTGTVMLAGPANASITGPWMHDSILECPSYHDYFAGCNGVDTVPSPPFTVKFSPAEDSLTGGTGTGQEVHLALSADGTLAGATNTYSETNYAPPFTLSQWLAIPCTTAGVPEGWPAFWSVGINDPSGTNEYDVAEVQKSPQGVVGLTAALHYKNAAGQPASKGVTPPGNWCGWHQYTVHVTTTQATFTWGSTVVMQWTAAQLGITSFSAGNQYMNDDYGQDPQLAGNSVPGSEFDYGLTTLTHS